MNNGQLGYKKTENRIVIEFCAFLYFTYSKTVKKQIFTNFSQKLIRQLILI